MIYAGGDLNLCSNKAKMWNDYDVNSAADVYVLRNAAKNVLYTTLSSNMVNGFNYKYAMAIWKIVLIVVNVVAFIGVCASIQNFNTVVLPVPAPPVITLKRLLITIFTASLCAFSSRIPASFSHSAIIAFISSGVRCFGLAATIFAILLATKSSALL